MDLSKRISTIKSRLAKLAELDTDYLIFGSVKHRYQSFPMAAAELVEFEKQLGIGLPPAFREFLHGVGYGAGPHYGIFSPERMWSEHQDWIDTFDGRGNLRLPFDLKHQDANDLIQLKKAHPNEFHYKPLETANGILPLHTEGCAFFSFIVLTGEQRGKIWAMDLSSLEALPIGVTQEFDFLDWYEYWLDISFLKLNKKKAPRQTSKDSNPGLHRE